MMTKEEKTELYQVVKGHFDYTDHDGLVGIPDAFSYAKHYSTYFEHLGFNDLEYVLNKSESVVIMEGKLHPSHHKVVLRIQDDSDGNDYRLTFTLHTLKNPLTESQVKWILHYIMSTYIHQGRDNHYQDLMSRLLSQESYTKRLEWHDFIT